MATLLNQLVISLISHSTYCKAKLPKMCGRDHLKETYSTITTPVIQRNSNRSYLSKIAFWNELPEYELLRPDSTRWETVSFNPIKPFINFKNRFSLADLCIFLQYIS